MISGTGGGKTLLEVGVSPLTRSMIYVVNVNSGPRSASIQRLAYHISVCLSPRWLSVYRRRSP